MKLLSEQILLRTPIETDLDQMLAWENDSSLWHVADTKEPFTREVMYEFVLSEHDLDLHKQLRFVIVGRNGEGLVGAVDLFEYEPTHQRVAVGILIDQKYRGQGFAMRSIQMILSYCFNTLHLHQVYCSVGKMNEASISLFEKCGFSSAGVKKDWRKIEGGWEDEFIFQRFKK